jgi:hypothetical protein|nr:MAG TPA: hypothetical protein [Caudoviricetes sp.]
MNTTENYGLKKPEKNEYISVDIINENTDMVDKTMKEQDDKKVDSSGGDTAETVVSAFEASSEEFPVPAAKEKAKTRWGKAKKFCEDFKAWMTGVCLLGHIVNNCVTNNPNLPLSAAQGKALMDLYTVLNTKTQKLETDIERRSSFSVAKDCNVPYGLSVYCDGTTSNTPFKQGLTQAQEGRCLSVKGFEANVYNSQLFITNGAGIFYRYVSSGAWANWEKV